MLELIGIPKTKTKKKKKIERILQRENSFIAERKKKTERTNQKERITEGKNERNDKKITLGHYRSFRQ